MIPYQPDLSELQNAQLRRVVEVMCAVVRAVLSMEDKRFALATEEQLQAVDREVEHWVTEALQSARDHFYEDHLLEL
jgi:hypothetical protein